LQSLNFTNRNRNYNFLENTMFNLKSFVLLTIVISLVAANNLCLDLTGVKYSRATDYWTVDVPCSGGSGNYNYQFDVPSGWQRNGSRIMIPTSQTTQLNNEYVIRCRVQDNSTGDVLERALSFKPVAQGSSTSLSITDHDYLYNYQYGQTSQSQPSTITGLDVLNRLSALVSNFGGFVNSGALGQQVANNAISKMNVATGGVGSYSGSSYGSSSSSSSYGSSSSFGSSSSSGSSS
jgi:hypothetical protein